MFAQTKTLTAQRSKNSANLSGKTQALKSLQADLVNREKQVAAYEGELEIDNGKLIRLQQQLDLAASIREARSAKKLERENLITERSALEIQDKELQNAVATAEAKLLDTAAALQKARDEAASVNAEKTKNDEQFALNEGPGQAESAKLMKEKENLAGAMNQLHQKSIEDMEKNNKSLKEQETALASLQKELKQAQEELQAVTHGTEQAVQASAEAEEDSLKEIKELTTLSSNLELAISAEQLCKEEIQKQKKDERKENMEKVTDESGQIRAELEAIREVLLCGKELVDSTFETEASLLSEICTYGSLASSYGTQVLEP